MDPLAVRRWPGGTISLETMSGLTLVINSADELRKVPGDTTINIDQPVNHRLWFDDKTADVQWQPAEQPVTSNFEAISVSSIKSSGENAGLAIDAGGISVVLLPTGKAVDDEKLSKPDLLVLMVQQPDSLLDKATVDVVKTLKPTKILLTSSSLMSSEVIDEFRATLGIESETRSIPHNTLVIAGIDQPELSEVVLLRDEEWKMDEEMSELYQAMDASRQASQAVFAALSTEQLNFRPSNGTHTPRWNTEHMMGCELLFFSQIFHAIDPTIAISDLNPKQMPPDYRAAHPDWDGLQEVRQTENVGKFTRRFAYLLDGVELDGKAPGSGWSLRGLLKQMARHYDEHTANTVKKFK